MEYGQENVFVHCAIIKDNVEYANSALRFDRPSSRKMQLQVLTYLSFFHTVYLLLFSFNPFSASVLHVVRSIYITIATFTFDRF